LTYFVKAGQRAVWILVCKWERADMGTEEDNTLCHTCIWALDAETGDVLCFATCM